MLVAGESPSGHIPKDIPLTQDARPKRAMPPWRAGFRHTRLADDEAKHCRSGAGSALSSASRKSRNLERPIKPKRHISARLVFQIIAGEAAGERDLHRAEIHPRETAAASRVIFLVTERAAFQPQREARRQPIAEPHQRPIFLEGSAVARVGGEEVSRREIEPQLSACSRNPSALPCTELFGSCGTMCWSSPSMPANSLTMTPGGM